MTTPGLKNTLLDVVLVVALCTLAGCLGAIMGIALAEFIEWIGV